MSNRAISPLDGRYQSKVSLLQNYVSEWALMKYRVLVEVRWLIAMSTHNGITHVRALTQEEIDSLNGLVNDFNDESANHIKMIERTTNHDVKAVEYFIRQAMVNTSLADMSEAIHFACTSEDINNLAYSMMFRDAIHEIWLPQAQSFLGQLQALVHALASTVILAHTHGQPATPTTMGKELAVFVHRLQRQLKQIEAQEFLGKFNGAVGAYNAHYIAYPGIDWQNTSRQFVESLGLTHNPMTTQIEPHDYLAELAHSMIRFNTILLDFCRDMWTYISMGYFKQRIIAGEVGSSTMPHKVNPIDFENAEANLGISNATLDHLANKLPVSRLQRDLSDSSALRNYGVGIAHSLLAVMSVVKGVDKVEINQSALDTDLDEAWEVLGEAVQTVLRKHNIPDAYEKLKDLTRGTQITQSDLQRFIISLDIPDEDMQRLLQLTPAGYIGLARELCDLA